MLGKCNYIVTYLVKGICKCWLCFTSTENNLVELEILVVFNNNWKYFTTDTNVK